MATLHWDRECKVAFGVPDQSIVVRHPTGLQTINVPGGMTPREFAAIIHAHDGYMVLGFGYAPLEIHPGDCVLCGEDTVNEPHWYIGLDY